MHDLITFAQALSDETRFRIVRLVADQALCVCELADILQMPQSSVSSHIQVIRKAELLASERCEKWVYYKLDGKYRSLVATLGKFFSVESHATLKSDALRARLRLAKRAQSCCPGPKTLGVRNLARAEKQ